MWTLRAWAVLSLVLMALAVWTLGSSPSFQECINQPQDYQANESLQGIGANFAVAFGALGTCLGRWIETNNNSINVLATAIIAVFTATLWISTHALWRVSTDAASAAQRSADAAYLAQRPWVDIRVSTGGPLSYADDKWHIRLKCELANIGNTPATDVSVFGGFVRNALFLVSPETVEAAFNAMRAEAGNKGWGLTMFPETEKENVVCKISGPAVDMGGFIVICGVAYGSTIDVAKHVTAKAFILRAKESFRAENVRYIPLNLKLSLLTNGSVAR